MKRLAVLVAVAFAVASAGCGSSGSGASGRIPVVVDTDLGSDDAIALLYLAASPRVDLRAVTVSGTGLVHCPAGTRNAAQLLALAGRTDVPVACGRELPLAGTHAVPEDWRTAADGLFGLSLPPVRAHVSGNAVSLLRREAPGATVLELAPMTNLAQALRADRSLARRIHGVVAMAGALAVPGNAPDAPAAETNAWLDPAAMHAVLRSGVPLTLVPLDATNHVPVTAYVSDAFERYHYATPEATLVWDLLHETAMADGGSFFWDPLAAASLLDPGVVTTAERRVDVLTSGDAGGRTVAGSGSRVSVAVGADEARFERDLLDTLFAGSAYTVSRRPTATVTWDGTACTWSGPQSLTAGKAVIETSRPFQLVVAAIAPSHTLADLRAYVAGLTAPPANPPSWLTAQQAATAQPATTQTWTTWASSPVSGSVVVACALEAPPYAAIAKSVPVYAG
jgi:inosine-uridine nucleoside N-ribohydrolase